MKLHMSELSGVSKLCSTACAYTYPGAALADITLRLLQYLPVLQGTHHTLAYLSPVTSLPIAHAHFMLDEINTRLRETYLECPIIKISTHST